MHERIAGIFCSTTSSSVPKMPFFDAKHHVLAKSGFTNLDPVIPWVHAPVACKPAHKLSDELFHSSQARGLVVVVVNHSQASAECKPFSAECRDVHFCMWVAKK